MTIEDIARGMTEAQKDALIPFRSFSASTGAHMVELGLLRNDSGVFTHTKLGQQVRAHLQSRQP